MERIKEKLVADPRYRAGIERCLLRPTVLVALTNVCNLSCAYCSTRNVRPTRCDMDTALAKSVVDQALENGWPLQFGQTYEPFLHPRVEEIIAHVHDKGAVFQSATNGLAIGRDAYDLPMNLLVSYSADEDDYAYRGAKPSFEAYQKRLLGFFRHRIAGKVPGVISVQIADYSIFRGALAYDKSIADAAGIWRKARLLAQRLDLLSSLDALDPEAAMARIADRDPLPLFDADGCRVQVLPTKIMPNAYDAFMALPAGTKPAGYCDSCWTMLSLQADGGAALCCCDPAARAVAGKITAETDLAAFWRGPEMTRVRERFEAFTPLHAFCTRCLSQVSEHIKPLLTMVEPDLVATILREYGVTEDLPWFAFPKG